MARQIDLSVAEAAQNIRTWVGFCAALISIDHDNLDILRRGLQRLVSVADLQFPELESSGETSVGMGPEDLGDFPLPVEVADLFVMLTGTILFNGADGPRPTGLNLERALDWINGAVLAKGANDDDDVPTT